jgi:hypothetical protein
MYVHPDVILDESPAISRARSNVVLSTSPNEKQSPDASHKPLFRVAVLIACFPMRLSPQKANQCVFPTPVVQKRWKNQESQNKT